MTGVTGAQSGDVWEVFACIVGTKQVPRHRMFHLSSDASPVTVVYPFWVVQSHARQEVTLIDTGFTSAVADQRQVTDHTEPAALLGRLGIDAAAVRSIVVTHAHFDHFGGIEAFPNADFHIQSAEVEYLRRHHAEHPYARIASDDVLDMLGTLSRDGRLVLVDGVADCGPVRMHQVGGHTPGTQVVELTSGISPLVFAGDAAHYFENLDTDVPTTLIHSYDQYHSGFAKIRELSAGGTWLPGHDPKMLQNMVSVGENVYRVKTGGPNEQG